MENSFAKMVNYHQDQGSYSNHPVAVEPVGVGVGIGGPMIAG